MRTIKFRGKDVNTREWLYGDFVKCNGETFISNYNEVGQLTYTKDDIHINKVIPETVCQLAIQYKEYDIYEHDLVSLRGLLGEVVFDSKKVALNKVHEAEKHKLNISDETDYEEY